MDSVSSDEVYQDQILPHVSRTFALTIPQLPVGLRGQVTSAYDNREFQFGGKLVF